MSHPEAITIDDSVTVREDSPMAEAPEVMEISAQPTQDPQQERAEMNHSGNWLQGRVATIFLGKRKVRCSIHERLLSARSPFFARTIMEAPADQDYLEIHLDDVDPKLFEMVLRWLYATAFAGNGGIKIFRYSVPDDKITVSDYLALYVLAQQLEIVGVKNAAIDVIYNYYGEATGELRVPNLNDVAFVFNSTPEDSHLRRLLIAHTLFYIFDKRRGNKPLPEEWEAVMRGNGEIAFTLIRMLADWNWVMGGNVPPMKIRSRQSFHEPLPQDCTIVKKEDIDESSHALLNAQLGVSVNPQPRMRALSPLVPPGSQVLTPSRRGSPQLNGSPQRASQTGSFQASQGGTHFPSSQL
ncbi:hypothetical protein OQA88_2006 [Cercophora sp. LCS_1]